LIEHNPTFKRAYEELDRFYWTEEELFAYEDALKKDWDYVASMNQKFDEGKAEGKAERDIEIAQTMIQEGLSIEKIQKMTGLSIEIIQEQINKRES
jgi:predicted transposase/invertase (TIGR01784 family)